jgi:hypothetical protein
MSRVSWYPHEVDMLILGVEYVEVMVHILGLGMRTVRYKEFEGTFSVSEK